MGRFDAQSVAVAPVERKRGRFDRASTPATDVSAEAPPLGFLNRAIATTLGGPVDLVNFGLNLMGLGSEAPIGGSRTIETAMGAAGIGLPEEGREPTTLGQRVERGVGETVGALLPFGAVASGVARGAGMAGQIARSMVEGVARAPVLTTAIDVASGAASGVGTQVAAEQFPDNPTAEALGALAGGLSPIVLAGVPRLMPGATMLARGIKGAVVPFTKAGATVRAERRIQDLVSDPEAVAQRLADEETIAPLTPAQQTGEKRLMTLEREVLNKDVSLENEFGEQTSQATEQLRREIDDIGRGDVGDARSFIEKRRARLTAALELRARQAAAEAERRIKQLAPELRASESSVIVREEIEKALSATRAQERELWDQVPQDISIPTDTTKAAYRDFRDDLSRAQRPDIPEIARRFLDVGNEEFRTQETVKEMQGLYSKLREESRIARAAGQFNTARIADGIADAIIDDIDNVANAGEAFDIARSFSRDLNQRFSQGAVGRILGRTTTGAPSVPPELTLQTTVGRGGARGAVEATQILQAAPGAQPQLGQSILDTFQRTAVRDGIVNPNAARKFARETEALDNFPEIRQGILDAAAAQERTARLGARATGITRSLRSANQSKTGEFLGARPGEEIARVIRSKDPASAMRELRRQIRGDKTGRALAGLKAASIDHLIQKSVTGEFDDAGQRALSGRALKAALGDRPTRDAVTQVLTKGEIDRIERIADELVKLETARGRLPDIGGIISDVPSSLLNLAVRVLGAEQGRRLSGVLGGGTIQTPGIFSARAQKLLTDLTNDTARELLIEAVQDKKLMAALLSPTGTLPALKVAARRFNAWIAGPGVRFAESIEERDETGLEVSAP